MPRPTLVSSTPRQIAASAYMGATTAALGLLLLAYPLAAGRLPMALLGWVLILVCVAQMVYAVHSPTVWSFTLFALRSMLFGGAGVWLVYLHPTEVETLTALLMAMLLAGAGIEIGLVLLLRHDEGREWVQIDAVTGFLMGALILAGWPANSVWTMGTLVGVSVVVAGVCRVAIVSKLRPSVVVVRRERAYQRAA